MLLTPAAWPVARRKLDNLQATCLRSALGLEARDGVWPRLSTFRGLWLLCLKPQRLGARVLEEGLLEAARAEVEAREF